MKDDDYNYVAYDSQTYEMLAHSATLEGLPKTYGGRKVTLAPAPEMIYAAFNAWENGKGRHTV